MVSGADPALSSAPPAEFPCQTCVKRTTPYLDVSRQSGLYVGSRKTHECWLSRIHCHLGEQVDLTHNPKVAGSNPAPATNRKT